MKDNKKTPDFDKLNDRVIAEASPSPTFTMRTNLDNDDALEDNPYYSSEDVRSEEERKKFKTFFNESEEQDQ